MMQSMLSADPELEVVDVAQNGRIALEKLNKHKHDIDVIVLDLDMPEMDGIEVLVEVRKTNTVLPIIVFSTQTDRGAAKTLEALTRGATDYVTKPSSLRGGTTALDTIRRELVPKVKTLGRRHHARRALQQRSANAAAEKAARLAEKSTAPGSAASSAGVAKARPGARDNRLAGLGRQIQSRGKPAAPATASVGIRARAQAAAAKQGASADSTAALKRPARITKPGHIKLLAIGTSTGGPNALAELLPLLPDDFPVPIVIVQHMPPIFTRILADRLSERCTGLEVAEGKPGSKIEPAHAYVAPGDHHMVLRKDVDGNLRLKLNQGPPEHSCRPAADVLFRSLVPHLGDRILAVVLTGMGYDGVAGCKEIAEAGGQVLVQDEASSVVWGMPGQVAKEGLAEEILPIPDLATEITRRVMGLSGAIKRKSR